jgi:hypothetical protein
MGDPDRSTLCRDEELGYLRARTRFAAGEGLVMDEAYRLAHLPLVAPDHPRAIPSRAGTHYDRGRHPRTHSLVLPVPGDALARTQAYRDLEAELRAAPFAPKLAWTILPRRLPILHATLCGSLGGERPPRLDPAILRELAGLGPVEVEVRGLFSGNLNVGRLYLRAYPERRAGENLFRRVQCLLGRPETDLYLIGVFNLTADLDAGEAGFLGDLIERWWDRPILRFAADRLWVLGSMDDLVLDGGVAEVVPLVAPGPGTAP